MKCIKKMPKEVLLHRLVAKEFVPNPNNYKYVEHINGILTDCRASNLRWVAKGGDECIMKK